MLFDIQREMAELFSHQDQFLASDDTTSNHAELFVASIHNLIDQCSENDLHGFADSLALYAELFEQVCTEEQEAPADTLTLLSEASVLFRNLSLKSDTAYVSAFLSLLSNPAWPEPVSEEDCGFLEEVLQQDLERLFDSSTQEEQESPPSPSRSSQQPLILHTADERLKACKDTETRVECCNTLVDQFFEYELSGLADGFALIAELFEQENRSQNAVLINTLSELLHQPDAIRIDQLLEVMTSPEWIKPLPADDAQFLRELLQEDSRRLISSPTEGSAENTAVLQIPDFCDVDSPLLEEPVPNIDTSVLQMLNLSLSELSSLWEVQNNTTFAAAVKSSLEKLEPIKRALNTLHLHGLYTLLNGLGINFQLMLESRTEQPESETSHQFKYCLAALLDLLNDLESSEIQGEVIEQFSSPALPCHLTVEQAVFIGGLLSITSVQSSEDIVQETAQPDDIVLKIHDDIDPNLQDMLFAELPSLVEAFIHSLQTVTETNSIQELTTAQRVAHTIKGLANMAGIQGLANLTHCLEDILDHLVDSQSLPSDSLKDDLLEAADCLAAMAEVVTDNASEPDNSLAILQRVMDWSYLLKTEGFENVSADKLPHRPDTQASQLEPDEAVEAEDSGTAESPAQRREENYLRVPQSLLDNLFRITGEASTLTAQLDEELTQLRALTRSSRERQRNMQRVIFELEQQLHEYYTLHPELNPETEGFDPLEMDNYHEMHTSISRLHEAAADVRDVEQEMDTHIRLLTDLHVTQSGLQKESLANVLNTRLVSVKSISARVQRILRQACRAANKKSTLIIEGEDTQLDSQILAQLTDPLMHIIRNAVDHGLETPEDRIANGKPETGTLTLKFRQVNDEILISCTDDGSGIDTHKVRAVAENNGLVSADATLSTAELHRLILLPGFSTRTEISQLSGRGIGMDVVYQQVMRLQGTLNIESQEGKGTRFDLTMPSSSLMIRALLVRSGRQLIALSSHGIEQSLISLDGTLQNTEQGLSFTTGDNTYPAFALETLTAERQKEYGGDRIHPVLIVNLGQGEKAAVLVREVIAHRELVFKEMGEYIPDIPGIPGVTILANGEAAPVMDLPTRIQHQQSGHIVINDQLEHVSDLELPKLMIVDDSVSARKSLATFLKDTGFEVSTAIDGLDALNQIRKQKPDLILTDYEMPRMNGVELSAMVRSREDTAHIPVIMITSRSTDKHRNEAKSAGISSYLAKPWTENNLLDQVQALLNRKPPATTPEQV